MPIYTKIGDKGRTMLLGGTNVSKDDPRIEACGSVDELSSVIGIVISFSEQEEIKKSLLHIQRDLFVVGAELASKNTKTRKISPSRLSELENEIDSMEAELTPLRHFIFPGGSKTASLLHLARNVARRAERRIVALSRKQKINPDILAYTNRLCDLLFIQARYVNRKKKVDEIAWRGR